MKTMEIDSYRKPSNAIAVLSAAITLIAMLVSIRSCQITSRSASLDVLEHSLDRVAEYDGIIQADGSIRVYPVNPNHNLQEMTAYLPRLFGDEPFEILPPDFVIPITRLEYPLQDFLGRQLSPEDDTSLVCLDARIPIILKSIYTVKGERYVDQSLYQIRYTFGVHSTDRRPDIQIRGLDKLHGPLDVDRPEELLSRLWKNAELQARGAIHN